MKKLLVIALAMALALVSGVMAATQQTATATVTVNAFLSVTIDEDTLAFGSLDPLAMAKPTDDPLVATIGPETNVGSIYIKTKANDATFNCTGGGCSVGVDTFAVSSMEWSATDFAGTGYTQVDAEVCSGKGASDTCSIYHQLTIPSGQAAGTYSVGITITATSV